MIYESRFNRSVQARAPIPRQNQPITMLNLSGLDLSSPYDLIEKNRSPEGRNFRLYAEQADDRKVSVSSRKGSGEYTKPLVEALRASQESVDGAEEVFVGSFNNWKADSFIAGESEPLTMVEVRVRNTENATGPIIVTVHKDDSGVPGKQIAESSLPSSDITDTFDYVGARFIEAPTLVKDDKYWVVFRIQEDGNSEYSFSTTTDTTTGLSSDSSGLSWTEINQSLNIKVYSCSTNKIKGFTRFAPSNGINITLIAIGDHIYSVNDNTGQLTSRISGLNPSATEVNFAYADDKCFIVNGHDTLRTIDSSFNVGTITDPELPILRFITFHKTRLFGVSGNNRVIWSETPGNPSNLPGNEQWYNAYLSTSFQEFPVANASEPITSIQEFQDNLYIFTSSGKYVLYGDSPRNFIFRESTGKKGSVNNRGVYVDENFIYFVADDGFYRFNGAKDEIISKLVQPEFARIANLKNVSTTKWRRQIRFYYTSSGSAVNNRCLIWHTVFEEWMMDTDCYVSMAIPLLDSNDNGDLIEASSTSPTLFFAEKSYSGLGKPIDFRYHCVYDSMGNPAIRKRIVKFFPLLEGKSRDYTVKVGIDRDLLDNPVFADFPLEVGGKKVGEFKVGDGTVVGGQNQYRPERIRVSGHGYYWQVIVTHRAVNNPVQFIGYVLSFKAKRL